MMELFSVVLSEVWSQLYCWIVDFPPLLSMLKIWQTVSRMNRGMNDCANETMPMYLGRQQRENRKAILEKKVIFSSASLYHPRDLLFENTSKIYKEDRHDLILLTLFFSSSFKSVTA